MLSLIMKTSDEQKRNKNISLHGININKQKGTLYFSKTQLLPLLKASAASLFPFTQNQT